MISEAPGTGPRKPSLGEQVGAKAARKLKARHRSGFSVWFGFGMMGLIGWSVTVPALLGTALGVWLDKHHPGSRSWTLALLIAGLSVGCLIAWRAVAREGAAIKEEQEATHE